MGRSKKELDAGKDNSPFGTGPHGGDRETDFPNDNGYGSHMERPGIPCPSCPAKFHFSGGLKEHTEKHH